MDDGGTGRKTLVIILIVVFVIGVASLITLFVTTPSLYPVDQYSDPPSRAALISGLRTAALAGFLGLAGIGTLIVSVFNTQTAQQTAQATADATRRSIELTQSGQLTERFTKAVELLGDKGEMTILGAIYALERLATDSAEYRPTVVQVLSAFVRADLGLAEHEDASAIYVSSDPDPEIDMRGLDPEPRDIDMRLTTRAAITVLGRIGRITPPPPELGNIVSLLGQARSELAEGVRQGAAEIDLNRTNLRRVEWDRADLRGADLTRCDLTGAQLRFADLRYAQLAGANLTRAKLTGANLIGARLTNCYFNEAELSEAKLGPSEYSFEHVSLGIARFDGAVLVGTNLRGVVMKNVRGLVAEQLEYADGDAGTILPTSTNRPDHWPAREVIEADEPQGPKKAQDPQSD